MLPKAYDPQGTEDRIYKMWEESGAFTADVNTKKETFTVSMPPPNATGQLHLGHAVMLALEDIFIRFARMQGKEALWVPGTDHAAIATENVVIKKLKDEGVKDPREELGREKLVEAIKEFVSGSQDTIRSQVRKMGSSCDWSREAYTMDEPRCRLVNEVFCKMFADDLIYRGHRIVNWDPKLQTNVSDDEVDWDDRTDPFYTFQYGPFEIGTVRPETKFGDKYVVMHPDDKRYKQYKHGDTFECEWINGPITAAIVKDESVDPEMGTGVMTITPWHSGVDFEIAERHGLDKEQIIDFDGNILPIGGEFEGMKIADAREKIIEKLEKKGLLVKKDEKYQHTVATNSRGGGMIEPQIKLQWFVDVNRKAVQWKGKKMSLKEVMQDVVRSKDITIIPERFEKIYFHWIDNLRDWCISRQIWWGHRVPVWYRGAEEFAGVLPPEGSAGGASQEILFMRHGESEAAAQNCKPGSFDSPLTEKGIEQAKEAAKSIKQSCNVQKIISSSLSRAQKTAEIIGEELELPVETWDDFIAFNFGELNNTPKQDKPHLELALEKGVGENLDDIFARAKGVVEKMQKLSVEGGQILFVGHEGFSSAVFAVLEGIDLADYLPYRRKFKIPLASTKPFTIGSSSINEWQQDPDTLDTWFSSALWTWSTLADPKLTEDYSLTLKEIIEKSPDYKTFHPTQVMETGYDILFFWVARMILVTTYTLGEVPFDTVYLHGLIRTRDGAKMSKSKPETMIDPLDIISNYGADALRLSMIVGQSPGNDSRLFEEKIGGYRNFVNKLWNASRFVLMQCEDARLDPHEVVVAYESSDELSLADRALLHSLDLLRDDVTEGLAEYRLSEVGERLYSFVWDYFCDWYLELSKGEANHALLVQAMRTIIQLLHPYCPFVTEELWSHFKYKDADMILTSPWPGKNEQTKEFADAHKQLQIVIDVITAIRSLRAEQGIEPGKKVTVIAHSKKADLLESQKDHIIRMGRLESLTISEKSEKHEHSASAFLKDAEVHIPLEGLIDIEKEKTKLTKERGSLENFLKGINSKLGNKKFVENADEEVVEKERQKLKDAAEKLAKVEERLKALS